MPVVTRYPPSTSAQRRALAELSSLTLTPGAGGPKAQLQADCRILARALALVRLIGGYCERA